MERADLMQQGIGPAEAREDDEAQHQAAELEWAITKMPVEILSLEWECEDQLPELTQLEYDLIYEYSKVVDGVRMFPYTKIWDHSADRERKVYLGA